MKSRRFVTSVYPDRIARKLTSRGRCEHRRRGSRYGGQAAGQQDDHPSATAYRKLTSVYKWRQGARSTEGLRKFSCVPLGLIETVSFP